MPYKHDIRGYQSVYKKSNTKLYEPWEAPDPSNLIDLSARYAAKHDVVTMASVPQTSIVRHTSKPDDNDIFGKNFVSTDSCDSMRLHAHLS